MVNNSNDIKNMDLELRQKLLQRYIKNNELLKAFCFISEAFDQNELDENSENSFFNPSAFHLGSLPANATYLDKKNMFEDFTSAQGLDSTGSSVDEAYLELALSSPLVQCRDELEWLDAAQSAVNEFREISKSIMDDLVEIGARHKLAHTLKHDLEAYKRCELSVCKQSSVGFLKNIALWAADKRVHFSGHQTVENIAASLSQARFFKSAGAVISSATAPALKSAHQAYAKVCHSGRSNEIKTALAPLTRIFDALDISRFNANIEAFGQYGQLLQEFREVGGKISVIKEKDVVAKKKVRSAVVPGQPSPK